MTDASFLPGLVIVVVVTAVVLFALLLVGLSRPGPRRAGLVAGGLPLALLPPVAAAAYASSKLITLFSEMAQSGSASMRAVLDACASLESLLRLAWGGFAATCVLGLVLGLVRSGRSLNDVACSTRRGVVLALLPALGLLLAGLVTHEVRVALRVTAAVVGPEEGDAKSRERSDAALEAAGLPTGGSGSIGAVANYLARAAMLGTFGGITTLVVLLGLALPGFILAWQVRFGVTAVAAASAAWLLAAVLGSLLTLKLT
jgi:hypothetical protein